LLLILIYGGSSSLLGRECSRVLRIVVKALPNLFRQFNEVFVIADFVLTMMPSGSTRMTLASLYSLPPIVLKSPASASEAYSDVKISSVVCQ